MWTSEQISHSARLVERVEQVGAARGAVDRLVDAVEDLLDLLVELGAVGDQQHPRVVLVLANPLGQPDHRQRLARALGVPDDAALALGDPRLGGLDAEVLVVAARLLDAGVEHHEVVDRAPAAAPSSTAASAHDRAAPRCRRPRVHASQYFSGVSITP